MVVNQLSSKPVEDTCSCKLNCFWRKMQSGILSDTSYSVSKHLCLSWSKSRWIQPAMLSSQTNPIETRSLKSSRIFQKHKVSREPTRGKTLEPFLACLLPALNSIWQISTDLTHVGWILQKAVFEATFILIPKYLDAPTAVSEQH